MTPVVLLGGEGVGPAVLAEAVRALGAVGFCGTWETPAAGESRDEVVARLRASGVALAGPGTLPLLAAASPGVLLRPIRAGGLDLVLVGPVDAADGLRVALVEALARARRSVVVAAAGADADLARGVAATLLGPAAGELLRGGRASIDVGPHRRGAGPLDRAAATIAVTLSVEDPARLVRALLARPEDLDVVVVVGPAGETLASVAIEAAGGSSRTPAVWVGRALVAFGPSHGPARRLAEGGAVHADPTAALLAAALLLDHLGASDKADRVREAVGRVVAEGAPPEATPSNIGHAVSRLLALPARPRVTTTLAPAEPAPDVAARTGAPDAFWDWDLTRDPYLERLEPGSPAAEWASRLHPDDRERVTGTLRRALLGRVAAAASEHRVRRSDGSHAHVAARAAIVRDEMGVPMRLVGAVVDVSERQELLARLQLADRLVSVGALVGSVAHGVNNPLQAVAGGVEQALEALAGLTDPRAQAARDALTHAASGAARVGRAIRDLQAFTQPEGRGPGPVDVCAAIEHALALAGNELRHRATVLRDLAPVAPVLADPNRLEQVFLNLLLHAARSLPEGHADAHEIRVVLRQAGPSRVAVEVHDTGPGIPDDQLERLFDPWTEADPDALSLSICREIVADLGGEIQVETEVGRGTCFHVFLAVAPAEPVAAPPPARPPSPDPAGGAVLVVEDDEDVADVVVRALQSRYRVVWVEDPREALARVASGERWDVILCDLMLPEMSGVELHALLSEHAPDQAARVVFMSGGVFTGRGGRALAGLPNPFLEKPFTMRQLREIVGRLVAEGPASKSPDRAHP